MFHIRKANRSDANMIAEFQIEMARETEDLSLELETVLKGVTAVVEDPSKGAYWIAQADNQSVAVLLTIPEWSDWRNGVVLWIHSLYVLPEYRKQGVFKRLYLHLKELVQGDDQYRGLRLYVEKGNVAAQKVYESLGMSRDHYYLYEWLQSKNQ